MKILKITFISICSILFFTSCEKEIDLDLDDSAQKIVVEAIVHDSLGDNYVLLSKTKPYKDNGAFQNISNASVIIKDNYGNTFNLYEVAPGIYTDSLLQGIAGRTYNLIVTTEGKTITASSTMPQKVTIDSLSLEKDPEGFWENPNIPEYSARCHFTDPFNIKNFYRLKAFLEGEQENGFTALNDDFIDGNSTFYPLFESTFYPGDSITIQLLSIDEINYRYFTALYSSQGGQVPGNPITNLNSDDAVGYFGAYAKSEQSLVVPE
jgi:hypothetical protein